MKLLLDTHAFLWFVAGSEQLSETARKAIEDPQNESFVSIASLWEVSIKTSLGKLDIRGKYETVIDDVNENCFIILPIEFSHTLVQHQLPWYHRNPFDRIIISQAIHEKMDIVGKDEVMDEYLKGLKVNRFF